jgi:hypothetical protein
MFTAAVARVTAKCIDTETDRYCNAGQRRQDAVQAGHMRGQHGGADRRGGGHDVRAGAGQVRMQGQRGLRAVQIEHNAGLAGDAAIGLALQIHAGRLRLPEHAHRRILYRYGGVADMDFLQLRQERQRAWLRGRAGQVAQQFFDAAFAGGHRRRGRGRRLQIQPHRAGGLASHFDGGVVHFHAARHDLAEQQAADGERNETARQRDRRVVGAGGNRDVAPTNIQRRIAGVKSLPGEGGAADAELGAGLDQAGGLAAHQRGDVDRALGEAPGQHAAEQAEQADQADHGIHEQMHGVRTGGPQHGRDLTGAGTRPLLGR